MNGKQNIDLPGEGEKKNKKKITPSNSVIKRSWNVPKHLYREAELI